MTTERENPEKDYFPKHHYMTRFALEKYDTFPASRPEGPRPSASRPEGPRPSDSNRQIFISFLQKQKITKDDWTYIPWNLSAFRMYGAETSWLEHKPEIYHANDIVIPFCEIDIDYSWYWGMFNHKTYKFHHISHVNNGFTRQEIFNCMCDDFDSFISSISNDATSRDDGTLLFAHDGYQRYFGIFNTFENKQLFYPRLCQNLFEKNDNYCHSKKLCNEQKRLSYKNNEYC